MYSDFGFILADLGILIYHDQGLGLSIRLGLACFTAKVSAFSIRQGHRRFFLFELYSEVFLFKFRFHVAYLRILCIRDKLVTT